MAGVLELQSAYLSTKARIIPWARQLQMEYAKVAINSNLAALQNKVQSLPPNVQAISQQRNPNAWNQINKKGA